MKVGLVTTGFPRFEGDHSGAFLLTLARGLVAQGHEVRVLAPAPARMRPLPRWPGIEVEWVSYVRPRRLQTTFYQAGAPDNLRAHPLRWVGAASFSISLLVSAARALDDCDLLVSSWCLPSGWVASMVARGRSHLCICHATDLRWLGVVPGGARIARRIARGTSAFWFLSATHRDRFFDIARLDPSSVVAHLGPMPIEPLGKAGFTRATARRALGLDRFTLLFLGRLVPVKGVDQLLQAAANLSEPVHIRIAGDGPERDRLVTLSQHLGVDAKFEGWVAGAHKEALFRGCDALLVPSRPGEGLPTVLMEARSYGLPIVATRVGAITDALKPNERIRLVAPNDPAALADAIAALRA